MNQSHLVENKSLYMKDKSELALRQCLDRCNKGNNDYKSLTNRQVTCICTSSHILEYCSTKFTNAYAYAFDIVESGGVLRASESQLKSKTLK